MLRKISAIIVIIVFIMTLLTNTSHAENITLEQIATTFNNSSTVKQYASMGVVWKASSSGDILKVEVTNEAGTTNFEYKLNGNILSGTFSGNSAMTGAFVSIIVVDSIGQLYGYKEGDLAKTLNSEEIKNYTLENEGFEVKQVSSGLEIKVDITKKIPLVDFTGTYIEVKDLEGLKNFIQGDGSAETSKGNVWFNKSGYNGENTVLVAEKDELTNNAYKSILSILQVMFGSENEVNYFKTNYPDFSSGNKEFNGFKVEVNPTKSEFEQKLIPDNSGYKFVRISINKQLVVANVSNNEEDNQNKDNGVQDKNNQEQNKEENQTIMKPTNVTKTNENTVKQNVKEDSLPKTGKEHGIIFIVGIITILAIIMRKEYKKYNIDD